MSEQEDRLMAIAGERASLHADYLAWVFQRYLVIEDQTEEQLAQTLGAGIVTLRRLAVCLRPRSGRFADDVMALAERFRLDPSELAHVVRLVGSTVAMDSAGERANGALLAARSRNRRDGGEE